MRIALTTNARLYRTNKGECYTESVYDYHFFERYLEVFENVRLIAHLDDVENLDTEKYVRVDGPKLEIYKVPFPHGKVDYLKKYIRIEKALKNSLLNCDAIILRIPDQLAFQVYKCNSKLPVAIEVTSDPWELYKKGSTKKSFFRPFIRLYWYFCQKRICKKAIGTSYVTKNYLQSKYGHSVGNDFFSTYYTDTDIDDNWIETPHCWGEHNELRIIHVATSIAGNAKGHTELLTAVGELINEGYNICLTLVGAGDLNPHNKEIVKKYKLEQQIVFTGPLPRESLRETLFKSDLFVFPSYVEGLPRVLVEAMASGLPCIATDLPGIRELLDPDWLVPVKDINKVKNKIRIFLESPSLRVSVGEDNKRTAKEYSIDTISKKRRCFYQNLKSVAMKEKG